jgi:hypothetical protein
MARLLCRTGTRNECCCFVAGPTKDVFFQLFTCVLHIRSAIVVLDHSLYEPVRMADTTSGPGHQTSGVRGHEAV